MTAPRWLLAAVLSAAVTPVGFGQFRSTGSAVPAGGTEIFRGVLARQGLRLIDPRAEPVSANTVVVVLGLPADRPDADDWLSALSQRVLFRGGAVLIAAEGPHDLSGFFPGDGRPQLTVTGERVACREPSRTLAGNPWCPFPTPVRPPLADFLNPSPEWELFDGVTALATNVPSALRLDPAAGSSLVAVAGYPPGCTVGGTAGAPPLPADRTFAVAAAPPGGSRCLVLADPSVYVNQMLAVEARTGGGDVRADNLRFAVQSVRWLRHRTNSPPRTECVVFENGTAARSLQDVPLAWPPRPPLPPLPSPLDPRVQAALTDIANAKLAEAEDANRLNQPFAGGPAQFARTLRWVAAGVAGLGAAWVVWKGRTYRTANPPAAVPGGTPKHRPRLEGRPPVDAADDVRLLRDYVRRVFSSRGLTAADGPAGGVPAVAWTGADAAQLDRQLRAVWAGLFSSAGATATAPRLAELTPMIEAVVRAANDGRWRRPQTAVSPE